MTLGYLASQKDAIGLVFKNFKEQLSIGEKKLDFQIKAVESMDAKIRG